jgi:hypothetical protein
MLSRLYRLTWRHKEKLRCDETYRQLWGTNRVTRVGWKNRVWRFCRQFSMRCSTKEAKAEDGVLNSKRMTGGRKVKVPCYRPTLCYVRSGGDDRDEMCLYDHQIPDRVE